MKTTTLWRDGVHFATIRTEDSENPSRGDLGAVSVRDGQWIGALFLAGKLPREFSSGIKREAFLVSTPKQLANSTDELLQSSRFYYLLVVLFPTKRDISQCKGINFVSFGISLCRGRKPSWGVLHESARQSFTDDVQWLIEWVFIYRKSKLII